VVLIIKHREIKHNIVVQRQLNKPHVFKESVFVHNHFLLGYLPYLGYQITSSIAKKGVNTLSTLDFQVSSFTGFWDRRMMARNMGVYSNANHP
jgi:hypothetical protein